MCGEASFSVSGSDPHRGPSPRVRGSLSRGWSMALPSRSIPACAGKPGVAGGGGRAGWVHPRVCGEASFRCGRWSQAAGPSPRVRGSPGLWMVNDGKDGSIPACAGKPTRRSRPASIPRVHPRVCGEALLRAQMDGEGPGPSPRVRGSPNERGLAQHREGSIPACAGKPRRRRLAVRVSAVHPRVCGEADAEAAGEPDDPGPSPRVRGSLVAGPAGRARAGSIPACAGKPSHPSPVHPEGWVHPRVCGEAALAHVDPPLTLGPSPRVRGSRGGSGPPQELPRSIPACAGKPARHALRTRDSWVHPRVCGEAERK